MKQLHHPSIEAAADEAARDVLDVVPSVMAAIRVAMRAYGAADLSIPQFRALGYLDRHPGASLSDVTDHVGLTLPTMSKLVDGLVTRGLVQRTASSTDRRYLTLAVTDEGRTLVAEAHSAAQADLAQRLAALDADEQAAVSQAMRALERVFKGRRQLKVEG